MPLPTRPVASADIATDWGQAIHDYTFAPAGCEVAGANVSQLSSQAERKLPLDTATNDPGGYLDAANDLLEVPTDGAGLYLIHVWVRTDEGSSSDETRVILKVNDVEVDRNTVGQEGSTAIPCRITAFEELDEGDQITVHTYQIGSGDRATVGVVKLWMVRLGAELGGP